MPATKPAAVHPRGLHSGTGGPCWGAVGRGPALLPIRRAGIEFTPRDPAGHAEVPGLPVLQPAHVAVFDRHTAATVSPSSATVASRSLQVGGVAIPSHRRSASGWAPDSPSSAAIVAAVRPADAAVDDGHGDGC